jgi:hypothetical protein
MTKKLVWHKEVQYTNIHCSLHPCIGDEFCRYKERSIIKSWSSPLLSLWQPIPYNCAIHFQSHIVFSMNFPMKLTVRTLWRAENFSGRETTCLLESSVNNVCYTVLYMGLPTCRTWLNSTIDLCCVEWWIYETTIAGPWIHCGKHNLCDGHIVWICL